MSDTNTRPIRYALFAWGKEEQKQPSSGLIFFSYSPEQRIPGDEWKSDQQESARKPKERLEFVSFVSSPSDVVDEVRKNPLRRYVLMTGTIDAVQIAMPVFVGGKNLSTMDKEWKHEELP